MPNQVGAQLRTGLRISPAALAIITLAMAASRCGDESARPSPPTGPTTIVRVVSVSVRGPSSVALGAAPAQLSAVATSSDGAQEDVTSRASWATSDPNILDVSAGGVVTVRAQGDAEVSATFAQVVGRLPVRVSQRLLDVAGRVVEQYGGAPIAGATVTVVDGPDAGRRAETDASGSFVLRELTSSSFGVSTTAPDFEVEVGPIANGTAPTIRLEPLSVTFARQGVFSPFDPQQVIEKMSLDVRHHGPIRIRLHSNCRVGDSEYGPLGLSVGTGPGGETYLMGGMLTYYDSDWDETKVVAPGRYTASFVVGRYPYSPPALPGCNWTAQLDYPK